MSWKTLASWVLVAMNWLTVIVDPAAAEATRPPALPKVLLETSVAATPVTGRTIEVGPGGDLQAALNTAQPGDEIVLRAGATYTGNFVLSAKGGSGKWITVRTSNMNGLPKEGVRVGPRHAAAMPKIVDPNGNGAISTALNAGYYRLIGLEVTVSPSVENAWALVKAGSGGSDQNALAVVAHHLILDRMYIHGDPSKNCFRCVALNSAHTAVIDSYLADGHAQGFDAQAICGWNGPGPFKIVNNYLEGSGENVMFGGADPHIPDLVPSDIEFRHNHCFKPLSWKIGDPDYAGIPWAVKNLFELKNARRVLIEGNVFENNWVHAQNGTAILFTVRNQDGKAPWCAVQDVTMINNVVRNSPTGFVVMGEDSPNKSQPSRRLMIRNNLFERIERMAFYITSAADDVEIHHNTFVPTNYMAFCMTGLKGHDASGKVVGKPCTRFKLTNNIMGFGLYGPGIDGGQNTFAEALPELTWDKNLFVGYGEGRAQSAMKRNTCPAGSLFEPKQTNNGGYGDADWPAVGFADYAGGDYRLTGTSKYKGLGADGKDLGVEMNELVKAVDAVSAANQGAAGQ
ncbi:MAG: right-handed parallel beta-helix repeat-containing protein [Planctomycetes bacterium]|nr:right-handed parallel beta-helix repeat-containing protein [Planctomycetota bacterium]